MAREARAIGALVVDPNGKVQIIAGDSQQEVAVNTVMVVMGGCQHDVLGKIAKPNKQVQGGPRAKQRKNPPLACFMCREKHIVKNCPHWQAVLEGDKKVGKREA